MQAPATAILSHTNTVGSPLVIPAGSAIAYQIENTSSAISVLADGGGGFVRIGPGKSVIVENGGAAITTISLAMPSAKYSYISSTIKNVSEIPDGETAAAVRIKLALL